MSTAEINDREMKRKLLARRNVRYANVAMAYLSGNGLAESDEEEDV